MNHDTERPVVLVAPSGLIGFHAGETLARFNWGRWVVDCASLFCTSALTLPPGASAMQCHDCGRITDPILWPDQPGPIEAILSQRPDVRTRNWEPGETLLDLIKENVQHGLIPDHVLENGGAMFAYAKSETGHTVALPVPHRHEIGA